MNERPDSMSSPTRAMSLYGVALGAFEGIRHLAGVVPCPLIAHALLCGHATECALKAIAVSGMTDEDADRKTKQIWHNLTLGWEAARTRATSLSDTPPDWLTRLNELHDRPHHLRYMAGMHGWVGPNIIATTDGIAALIVLARPK